MANLADFHRGDAVFQRLKDNLSLAYQRQTILVNTRKGVAHVDPEEMLSPLYKGEQSCLPQLIPSV